MDVRKIEAERAQEVKETFSLSLSPRLSVAGTSRPVRSRRDGQLLTRPGSSYGFIPSCLGKREENCFESNKTIQSSKQVPNAQIKLLKLLKVANSPYFDLKALFCKRDAECSTEENIHQKSKSISRC